MRKRKIIFEHIFNKYLKTLDEFEQSEWYGSDKDIADEVFKEFMNWLLND